MDKNRLTKKVFLYSLHQNRTCKNWANRVSEYLKKLNCDGFLNVERPISKRKLLDSIRSLTLQKFLSDWKSKVIIEYGTRRNTGNKLRKYNFSK